MSFPFPQLPFEFVRSLFAVRYLDLGQSRNLQFYPNFQGRVGIAGDIERLGVGLEQGEHDLVATDRPIVVNLLGDVPQILAAAHRTVDILGQGGQRRCHSQQKDAGQYQSWVHQNSP